MTVTDFLVVLVPVTLGLSFALFIISIAHWLADRSRRRTEAQYRWDSVRYGEIYSRRQNQPTVTEWSNRVAQALDLNLPENDPGPIPLENWYGESIPRLAPTPRIGPMNYGTPEKCAGLPQDHECGPVVGYMKNRNAPARWYYCEVALEWRKVFWAPTMGDGWTFPAIENERIKELKRGKANPTMPALPDVIRRSRRSL